MDRLISENLILSLFDGKVEQELPLFSKTMTRIIKGLPSAEPKWIPVSERLPDTDDEVLCWYEYYHWKQEKVLPEYGIGCYLKETSLWFGEVANGHKVRVIAWMPLPKPYEPQE